MTLNNSQIILYCSDILNHYYFLELCIAYWCFTFESLTRRPVAAKVGRRVPVISMSSREAASSAARQLELALLCQNPLLENFLKQGSINCDNLLINIYLEAT